MTSFTNAIPGGSEGEASVLSDVWDYAGLAYNQSSSTGTTYARAVTRGGYPSQQNVGAEAFWATDLVSGLPTLYPIADQCLLGNTRYGPRTVPAPPFATMYHQSIAAPLGYFGEATEGSLAALPYALRATLTVVASKESVGGAGWAVGFENFSTGGMFGGSSQGAMGFLIDSETGESDFSRVIVRGDADISGTPIFIPITPRGAGAAGIAVKVVVRVTWGRVWLAEFFVNDQLAYSLDPSQFAYANLETIANGGQRFAYPRMYVPEFGLKGPYFSRATLERITP